MKWWKNKEKSNYFWLKVSVLLVKYCPDFLLKIIVFFIALFFYFVAKNERRNISMFYERLSVYVPIKKKVFSNFYNFSISLVDKFKVLLDKKIEVVVENEDFFKNNLIDQNKGSIILISHFGNFELAKYINGGRLKLHILMYSKHASSYIKIVNELSKEKIEYIEVSELDMNTILKMSEVIQKGEHIVIMGDRASINDNRNSKLLFLGKETFFAQGAFLLASILNTKIYSLWCIKDNNKYLLSCDLVSESVNRKDLDKYVLKYVNSLEIKVKEYPQMWFNFYDYWGDYEKNIQS